MFLMLELTFKDFDIMFFYDRWEVTVLIDFRADPTRCSVVGGISLILQVGTEVSGSVSKAGLGKVLSLLSKRPRRRFCAQRCLILDSPGVWFPLWIPLVSWVLLLWTSLLVHAKKFFKWPILLLFQTRKSVNEVPSENLKKDTVQ